MKHVKMLGLAAVAAMAFMAFLGASSASATVLCKTQLTSGCAAAGWDYPSGTTITASLEGTATLETTGGLVIDTCSKGTVSGATGNTGGTNETVSGNITTLTFEECSRTTDVLANGSLEIHWISGTDNGTVTGKNSNVTISSPLGGHCDYGTSAAGTHLGTLTATPKTIIEDPGGIKTEVTDSMATLHIEAIVPLIQDTSPFKTCPEDARWTGSYTVTTPEPLHVSTS